MGSREGVASKIDVDTQKRLQEMLQQLAASKGPVLLAILEYVYDIQADLHKSYRDDL